jgi:oxygen-dependent protoporphyrinogen oxidase
MKKAHTELFDGYKGRLHVAGNSYTGVGLNDCVRAARDVAMKLKNSDEFTGLDGFAIPKVWAEVTVK